MFTHFFLHTNLCSCQHARWQMTPQYLAVLHRLHFLKMGVSSSPMTSSRLLHVALPHLWMSTAITCVEGGESISVENGTIAASSTLMLSPCLYFFMLSTRIISHTDFNVGVKLPVEIRRPWRPFNFFFLAPSTITCWFSSNIPSACLNCFLLSESSISTRFNIDLKNPFSYTCAQIFLWFFQSLLRHSCEQYASPQSHTDKHIFWQRSHSRGMEGWGGL